MQGLIEIENPNRAVRKATEKVTKINLNEAAGSSKPELSRREREEIEKQRAQANYQKLHAEGKTDQARADLARLAIIKQHRAEAAARREAEKKGKRWRFQAQNMDVIIHRFLKSPLFASAYRERRAWQKSSRQIRRNGNK